jgi:hypothetical protein
MTRQVQQAAIIFKGAVVQGSNGGARLRNLV